MGSWRSGGPPDDFVFPSRIADHISAEPKPLSSTNRPANLRAVQILLGHTKIESTIRNLGVDVEDALTLAERTDV
jgi:hypothetical protein